MLLARGSRCQLARYFPASKVHLFDAVLWGGPVSEESDRMMVLLQELAALKKDGASPEGGLVTGKRRREITQEMKRLASEKKDAQE